MGFLAVMPLGSLELEVNRQPLAGEPNVIADGKITTDT
jgi:hypothetical protein